jgi:predicted SAM-dependent methyltransferase
VGINGAGEMTDPKQPFDAAVVIPTTLRPSLERAVRSVFTQDISGRVQILIGVDRADGPAGLLDSLVSDCPDNMLVTVVDPGHSTSTFNGGIYPVITGGGLRTALSYLANSQYLAYLDDDNWWAPHHLSSLLSAIAGFDWAFSLRWFVDPETQAPLCIDAWESVGPGRGLYAETAKGFVDTNTLMIDKLACHWALPAWSVPVDGSGRGVDRTVFERLRRFHPVAWTDDASTFYVFRNQDRDLVEKLMAERPDDGAAPEAVPWTPPPSRQQVVAAEYLDQAITPRLRLGAAGEFVDGWLNAGPNPQGPDVLHIDPARALPFGRAAFDCVMVDRIVETLSYEGSFKLLSECFRILKAGGLMRLITADLGRILALYSRYPTAEQKQYVTWAMGPYAQIAPNSHPTFALNNLFAERGNRFVYDDRVIGQALQAAGFRDLKPQRAGKSDDPDLTGVERDGDLPPGVQAYETMVWEGRKP